MANQLQEFLADIYADPRKELLLQALKNRRPSIPAHDPNKDNTEFWKARSAQRDGFDLCLSVLNINHAELEKCK